MNITAKRIIDLADEKKIKLKDLADAVELNANIFASWEKKNPSLPTAIKFAQYFSVSMDYLVGITDVRTPPSLTISDGSDELCRYIKASKIDPQKAILYKQIIENVLKFNEDG